MTLPILHTSRLTLRPYSPSDVDALHSLWIESDVRRYLWNDVVIPREQAEEVVSGAVRLADEEGLGQWLILAKPTELLAGFCGFIRRDGEPDPELIYGLRRAWWGRGLATEAAERALAFAFTEKNVTRVTAATDPPNEASLRVMERLGMRFTHRGRLNGLDTVFYELGRDDWAAGRGKESRHGLRDTDEISHRGTETQRRT
jgi:[ribosomal protein S5]-alanine N-acetyltransferase